MDDTHDIALDLKSDAEVMERTGSTLVAAKRKGDGFVVSRSKNGLHVTEETRTASGAAVIFKEWTESYE